MTNQHGTRLANSDKEDESDTAYDLAASRPRCGRIICDSVISARSTANRDRLCKSPSPVKGVRALSRCSSSRGLQLEGFPLRTLVELGRSIVQIRVPRRAAGNNQLSCTQTWPRDACRSACVRRLLTLAEAARRLGTCVEVSRRVSCRRPWADSKSGQN